VIIAGDGTHQIAAQEIGQFFKFGLKPVFIVVNNDGYLVERYTCRDPESSYNDLPKWRYHMLPAAFGCEDWYCVRVTTTGELDEALAEVNRTVRAAFIEVVTDRYSMPPYYGDSLLNPQSMSWIGHGSSRPHRRSRSPASCDPKRQSAAEHLF